MAATLTLTRQNGTAREVEGYGKVVFSGNYPTGGEALNFITAGFRCTGDPILVDFGEGKAGFKYEYDYTNKKVIVRQDAAAGAPSAELPAAAYPAGVTGDQVSFRVFGTKLVSRRAIF